MEPGCTAQGLDWDATAAQFSRPRPFGVEAADRHREVSFEPPDDLDDKAFRSTGIQAENDLKHPRHAVYVSGHLSLGCSAARSRLPRTCDPMWEPASLPWARRIVGRARRSSCLSRSS